MVQSLGPGWFSRVALGGGRGYLVARMGNPREPGPVRLFSWPGADVSQASILIDFKLDGGSPAFPWVYWHAGDLWVAYHDGQRTAHLWKLSVLSHQEFTPCENNSPLCFGGGYFAWQGAQSDGWPVTRIHLVTGEVVTTPNAGQGTGLSRVNRFGVVWLVDQDRFSRPGMTQPTFPDGDPGEFEVGENTDARLGARWRNNSREGVLWGGQEAFTPHIAADGELVAITASGGADGVRVFCGTRDELYDQPVPAFPAVPINRKLWAGWFMFGSQPGLAPGNCVVPAEGDDPHPIVPIGGGRAVGTYVSAEKWGNTPSAFRARIEFARARWPDRAVVAYWPRAAQEGPVPEAEYIGVEAYRRAAEPVPVFEARVRAAVARCQRVALICQCYTSNLILTDDLASLVPVYARIARDCPNVEMLLLFSDGARATGLPDHPEVLEVWRALLALIPGPAAYVDVTPPTPDPPKKPPQEPPQKPPVDPVEDEDMPLTPEQFEEYVKEAHDVLRTHLGYNDVDAEQGPREMKDRYPEWKTASLDSLVAGGILRSGHGPIKAEQLDVIYRDIFTREKALQERLRR